MDWQTNEQIITSVTEIVGLVIAIGGPFLGLISWIANRKFAKIQDMFELKDSMDKQDRTLDNKINSLMLDVGVMKETIRNQPTRKDLEEVGAKVSSVAMEVARIGAVCNGQNDILRSIDQRLIERTRS